MAAGERQPARSPPTADALHTALVGPLPQLAIPALLYTLQNNMLYVGFTHLEVAVGQVRLPAARARACARQQRTLRVSEQVMYQTKILFTAICSVLLLGKRLSVNQWLALVILTGGIVLVQAPRALVVGGLVGGGAACAFAPRACLRHQARPGERARAARAAGRRAATHASPHPAGVMLAGVF